MGQKRSSNIDEDLRQQVGHDATSTFESDPRFEESDPTEDASSENLSEEDEEAEIAGEDESPELESEEDEELLIVGEDEDSSIDGSDDSLAASWEDRRVVRGREVSTDITRLEGGSQSARGRGTLKTPRQAA